LREYKVNELLSLKLEDGNTIIQVNGQEFVQCKGVVLNRTLAELKDSSLNMSIDELADWAENEGTRDLVPPETEFWVHCSNLSAWAENDYNSELLHSNLAFPLLRRLVEAGDETAKRVFKEEIIKRLESGYFPVITYLSEEGYDEYLTREEWYNAILGHDLQGFREADALIDLEEMMGRKLDYVNKLETEGGYDLTIEDGKVRGIALDTFKTHALPESIGNLEHLQELYYINSEIKELPDSFGNLVNLRTLDLRGNKLKHIPEILSRLEKLIDLKLSFNDIKDLPEKIGDISKLINLDLSHNKLEILPDSFNQLRNLKFLNLGHNKLTDIPNSIHNFFKLEELNLSHNQIKKITQDINKLTQVNVLHLNDNLIDKFPEGVLLLKKLRILYISSNNLNSLPESFGELNPDKKNIKRILFNEIEIYF